jgi:hypothetical protein
MAFLIVRQLDINADRALKEVASLAGLWRDPDPAASSLTHTRVRVHGQKFSLYVRGFVGRGTLLPEVHGTISASGAEASTLSARVGLPFQNDQSSWLLPGALASYLAWEQEFGFAALLVGVVALEVWRQQRYDRAVSYRGTPVARILANHIDAVLTPYLSDPQSVGTVLVA